VFGLDVGLYTNLEVYDLWAILSGKLAFLYDLLLVGILGHGI
jgi:hypothetical protein